MILYFPSKKPSIGFLLFIPIIFNMLGCQPESTENVERDVSKSNAIARDYADVWSCINKDSVNFRDFIFETRLSSASWRAMVIRGGCENAVITMLFVSEGEAKYCAAQYDLMSHSFSLDSGKTPAILRVNEFDDMPDFFEDQQMQLGDKWMYILIYDGAGHIKSMGRIGSKRSVEDMPEYFPKILRTKLITIVKVFGMIKEKN